MLPCTKSPISIRLWLAVICGVLPFDFGGVLKAAQAEHEAVRKTPPEPTWRAKPEYPFEMRRAGMMGGAVVEFVVTSKGKVTEPQSVAETDPAFGDAAVKAVAKWKFKPGTEDGKPTNNRMAVPIYFIIKPGGSEDLAERIQAVITGFPPKSPAGVSEEFQYDTAPTPTATQAPVWPWVNGVPVREGTADLFFAINAKGHVVQVRIVSATNEAIGEAARAAMECWEFKPAERDGKPVPALGRREVKLKLYLPKEASELRLLHDIEAGTTHYAKASKLDAALKPLSRDAPKYPLSLMTEKPAGTAVIECIVDGHGRVCLPRIISASQSEFGWAAATAAASWRFDPPTVGGQPVDVKIRIPFEFQGRQP